MLQDAHNKGLSAVPEELKQLAQKERDNRMTPVDYEVCCAY
jgi:pyruvate/2-oxoglutarate dehydrogenase complex dihydrolipoamide acyltransferase (E2) component